MNPMPIIRSRVSFTFLLAALLLDGSRGAIAQGIFSIQSVTGRPFVTGVTPVIGPRGAVGGVSIDTDGVVSRPTQDEIGDLVGKWQAARKPQGKEIATPTPMRMISLKRLDQALSEFVRLGESPPEEMFFLAGLQRIEYVFAFPQDHDLVLAGPAEGWRISAIGEVVGATSGKPVLRLDDLMEALRVGEAARSTGISCSIEPTEVGRQRYARLVTGGNLKFNPATMRAIEQAMGGQQILLTGVETDGHFARVMVAADYMMKLLAMGLEPSPVDDMPDYLQMLRRQRAQPQISSPRWWMTVNYQPLLHSADALAWQIRGQGLKTLTEDGVLDGAASEPRGRKRIRLPGNGRRR